METFDICVTTYEAYVAEDTWFKSRRWTYCVLDEGHKIKNSETNIAHKVQGIGSLFRLGQSPFVHLPDGKRLMDTFADKSLLAHPSRITSSSSGAYFIGSTLVSSRKLPKSSSRILSTWSAARTRFLL